MNRNLTLAFAGAGTVVLILTALIVYPSVYVYDIYPQTQTTSMYVGLFSNYRGGLEPSKFNASNFSYFHVTEAVLQQYPQLREGFQLMNITFRRMNPEIDFRTTNSQTGVRCEPQGGDPYFGGGCYNPIIPFKIVEVPKVIDALQMDKYNGRLEHNGEHYQAFIAKPNLEPIYSTSLLYGIFVTVVGSLAIWLMVARTEGRRNTEEDEEKTA